MTEKKHSGGLNMPNYCRECCEKYHIGYDPTGKTCWMGMTCDGCGKKLNWFEEMGEEDE